MVDLYPERCEHSHISVDGHCLKCGIATSDIYFCDQKKIIKTKITNGIQKDLSELNIPDNIKSLANDICIELNPKTRRGNSRKRLVFYCIIKAYETYENTSNISNKIDPKQIALSVGIKTTEIGKCMREFDLIKETKIYTPMQFINFFTNKIKIELDNKQIIRMTNNILEKDTKNILNGKLPQMVAVGMIYYFMIINGVEYNKKEYSIEIGYSTASIDNIIKTINEIDNS